MSESRDDPPRSLLSKLFRGGGAPTEFRKWIGANWSVLAMMVFIFLLALFIRSYFAFDMSVDNDFIVSGGSDSYYWRRIIDYHVETGDSMYWDPLINFPDGIRNPRPPFYSMSVALPAVIAEDLFETMSDAVGFMFVWSTAFWGALTVVPVYFLGKETFGRRAGLVAAFLLAITPSHVQRSVLSNADHDAFILFFIVLTFYLLLRAVKIQEHVRWVDNWKSIASIRAGLGQYLSRSKAALLYALLAGVSFGCVVMAWVGFTYVAVLILAYLLIQILLNRFKNIDSLGVTLLVFVTMGFGYLISFPVYYEQTLISVRFDVPVYLFLAAMIFAMMFVVSRDYPWTMAVPTVALVLIIGIMGIAVAFPALGEAIMTGQGYFVQSKLYSTIAEARAPEFSELAMSFGMVTFFISLAGLFYAITRVPKQTAAGSIFMVVWLSAAIFMAMSAGRFMFNAAPAFALAAGWVLTIIIDKLDFGGVRKSFSGASGSIKQILRKSIKIRHVVGALFLAFFIIMPNVWYSVDAGIPSESKREYDKQVYFSMPSFMRPGGYDTYNGSNWYLGAFGYSLPLPSQYYPSAWDWFAEQDSDKYPETARPAYVAWWDYGFEAVQEGKHPTVADNFQNGYQLTGNALMAQGEEDAIALFAFELAQSGYGRLSSREKVLSLFEKHGISSEQMINAFTGSIAELTDEIIKDPDRYGPMASDISSYNARIVFGREVLCDAGLDSLVSFYDDLCALLGWEIRYFNVDSRLFPISATNTGIFYAPAKLSDRRIQGGSIPIDFFEIKAVTSQGQTIALESVTSDMSIANYVIEYKDMFYDSMFYRAMCGFSGSDLGAQNDGLPGYSGTIQNEQPMPGWNMSHFKMVYRTAFYNPYTADLVPFHQNAWRAVSYDDAQDMLSAISAGEIEGVIDQGARTLYMSGTVFLKYYHGAFLNGTVTTEEGTIVSGARMTVQDEYGIPHDTCLTDANGRYSLLAPFGEVTLVVSSGDDAKNTKLQGSQEISRYELTVTDDQAMRVRQDLDFDGVYDYIITKDCVVKSGELVGDIFWDLNEDGNFTSQDDDPIGEGVVFAENKANGVLTAADISDGYYSMLLPPGQYEVYAEMMDTKMLMSETLNVSSEKTAELPLPLKPARLRGNVTTVDGAPVAGLELVLENAFFENSFAAVTNESGSYVFPQVLGGRYNLVTYDPELMLFNERMNLGEGGSLERDCTAFERITIKMRVTKNGTPVSYAPYIINDVYYPRDYISGLADRFGWVEADVPRGYWTLYSAYSAGEADYAGFRTIDGCASDIITGTLQLESAFTVTGSPRGVRSTLIKNTHVVFIAEDGTRIFSLTNGLGEFDLRLPGGQYEVLCWAIVGDGLYSGSLTVDSDMNDLRLLGERGVIVTGTLWKDDDSSGSIGEAEFGAYALMEVTDAYGRVYTTRADDEGDYRIMAKQGVEVTFSLAEPGYSEWSTPGLFGDDAKNVTLFATPDDLTVTGRVVCDSVSVRGATVSFLPNLMTLDPIYAITGTDGQFTVAISPSDYRVEIDHESLLGGDSRIQYLSTETFEPSEDAFVYDISAVRRVELHGNVLGAAEDIEVKIEGPEDVTLKLDGFTYSAYVEPGTYQIFASGKIGDAVYASMVKADVAIGSTQFDLMLEKACNVTGVAHIDSVPSTKPVKVTATTPEGVAVAVTSSTYGSYEIVLPPGSYALDFSVESTFAEGGRVLYVEYTASEIISLASEDVTLNPDMDMRLDNTTITGVATGIDGSPTQAQIVLSPNTAYGLGVTIYTDPSGSYAAQVQPGDYTVYAKRTQDSSVSLGFIEVARDETAIFDIDFSDGKFLSGRVTAEDIGIEEPLTLSKGDATLSVRSDSSGYFSVLVPSGDYVLAANTERVEAGMTVEYSLSKSVEIGSVDVFVDFALNRYDIRSVEADWNSSVALPAIPGQAVTYAFTVENTGNIGDDYTCFYDGQGFEVAFVPTTQYIDFGTNGNEAVFVAEITVLEDAPGGDSVVPVQIRSESSSSARAEVDLVVKVPSIYRSEITISEPAYEASGDTVQTPIVVVNTGNVWTEFAVEVTNIDTLKSLGWSTRLISAATSEEVDTLSVDFNGEEELVLEYTTLRNDPDPSAEATIVVSAVNDTSQITFTSVPIYLPDISILPGDLEADRDDVSYVYDSSNIMVNIGLACAIGVLIAAFILLRRRKGLGGKRKGEAR
ncbi:MAG: glycosyltransferase family 39 protein [Methanobacteriota archaeon]|nr:MAG: glycosyltransferase family 39 protein [Euryarchaeota archaeon]